MTTSPTASPPGAAARPAANPPAPDTLADLARELDAIIARAASLERARADLLDACAVDMRESARNLLHYLALRQADLRPLQRILRDHGLSSLGRAEACVMRSLLTVRNTVRSLAGEAVVAIDDAVPSFASGENLLAARAEHLFGSTPHGRATRIMVTMPSAAATDAGLVRGLAAAGMDVMRINSAHDDGTAWRAMLAHARAADGAGQRCPRVVLDLAGPKLRTGPAAATVAVLKVKPRRGPRGEVLEPGQVALTAMALPAAIGRRVRAGDQLEIRDPRQRWRIGEVVSGDDTLTVTFARTTYLEGGAAVRLLRHGKRLAQGRLGELPAVELPPRVELGDRVRLMRRAEPGADGDGIGCTLPVALEQAEIGQRVWFDDGRIGGTVSALDDAAVDVRIEHVRPGGAWLRAGKGINLPDTRIELPALTADDRQVIDQFAREVDLVGMSFVQSAADVQALHAALDDAGAPGVAVILKIETRRAFEALPRLLLAAMCRGPFAVMVARGDLAVEVGFERLAEVQEEILWLCEAAHVPVVWATQVLDNMARTGLPSRAEVTDAAMAERAECVMLNKGPYITETVALLDDVLRRMHEHQHKKTAMLRRLAVSVLD